MLLSSFELFQIPHLLAQLAGWAAPVGHPSEPQSDRREARTRRFINPR